MSFRWSAMALILTVVVGFLVFHPGFSVPANAAHLRGGIITAEYHAPTDHHPTEEVHISATMLATIVSPANFGAVSVYRLDDDDVPQSVDGCTQSSTTSRDTSSNPLFSINVTETTITGCFGDSGTYVFSSSVTARVSGIDNASYSAPVQYEAQLEIDGENDSEAPTFSSGFMYNIAYSSGLDYSTNMNGLGQGSSAVTYSLVTSTATSLGGYGASKIPCSDLNETTGVFRINLSFCEGTDTISSKFGSGQLYALKVKATDSRGQYSTRDVLLQFATTSNTAPSFSAYVPAPGSLSVTPGSTATIVVSATDVDGDTIDFTENLSKSWITESSVTTSGSGASTTYTKTYTLAPPIGTNETVQFEISAFDDDSFSLSTSVQYDIEAGGVLPPGVPGTPTLVAGAASLTATFSAPISGGTVASYRADATPTSGGTTIQTACSAPPAACALTSLAGLTEYSVVIVATNESASASSNAATETTLAASSPPAPAPAEEVGSPAPAIIAEPTPAPVVPRRVTPRPEPIVQQGPVLRGNVPPAPPSAPVATISGRSISIQTQLTSPTGFSLTAGVLNLGLQVQQDQGVVRQNSSGGTEVEVKKGSTAALSGSGLLPRSTVQVFLPLQGTNSKELARIPVDETGSFMGDAVFATRANERPLPIGRQVLQVVSLDETGQQSVVEMTVNIAQSAPAPEPDRTVGATPTLRPGQSLATNAGEPEVVTVVALPEDKRAVIEGDGWQMAVNVAGDNGAVQPSPEGGAVLELVRDETAVVSGSGFMPLTRADVWLFSDPTLLGTVDIDENGEFNGEVNVDGNVVAVGEHTLQLQGVGEDGYVRAANLGVVVNDTAAPVTTEEAAGGFLWWLWIVVLLVAILVWFVVWRWRKREQGSL